MSQPVRPSSVAIWAGVVVALYVMTCFLVRPVPDSVVSLLGGPEGVDRVGGLRLHYRPPAGSENALARSLDGRGTVHRDGDVFVLEYPEIAQSEVSDVRDFLVAGGLTMREVLETDYVTGTGIPMATREQQHDVVIEADLWRTEDGESHGPFYLRGWSREAIERALSDARTQGWSVSSGSLGYDA